MLTLKRLMIGLLVGTIALGGCTLFSSSKMKIPQTGLNLCSSIPKIRDLVVVRTFAFLAEFSFPVRVDVHSAQSARKVAEALCELPVFPRSKLHCPPAFAVDYLLGFRIAGMKGMGGYSIRMNPTGCQEITIPGALHPHRWIATRPDFYRVLGRALGLTRANQTTFEGH